MIENYGKFGVDPTYDGETPKMYKSQEFKVQSLSSTRFRERSHSFIRGSKNLCSKVTEKPKFLHRKRKYKNAVDQVAKILHQTGRAHEYKSVKDGINHSIKFTLQYRKQLLRSAKTKKSSIYLNPESITKFLKTKKSKETYCGYHIQVNIDGSIYVIPKTKEFKIGYGAFKRVRLAVELGIDGKPKRAIAIARVSAKKVEKLYKEQGNLKDGETFSPEERKELYDNICAEVKKIREMIELRGKELGFSADDIKFSVYGTDEGFKKADFVMPFCELGDLEQGLESLDDRWDAVLGCVQCVNEWHGQGYAHFDIKPSNFLGTRNLDGKIHVHSFDLAFSHKPSPDPEERMRKGTLRYLAPEVWNHEEDFAPFKADIFALGITLYQIMNSHSQSLAFPLFIAQAQKGLKTASYHSHLQKCWNLFYAQDGFEVLFKAMTHPDPSKRPDINQVAETLTWIRDKSPAPKKVAKKLDIPRGESPKKVGSRLANSLLENGDSEYQKVIRYIHKELFPVYTPEEMRKLYQEFEQFLHSDTEEKYREILTTIQILIEEQEGTVSLRALNKHDISAFNQRRYSLNSAAAFRLLGPRDGAWTFYTEYEGFRAIVIREKGEKIQMNVDHCIRKKKNISLDTMHTILIASDINPDSFVPKSFPKCEQ